MILAEIVKTTVAIEETQKFQSSRVLIIVIRAPYEIKSTVI